MAQVVGPDAVPPWTAPAPDDFAERQDEIADAALPALGRLGYARTSLQEIADAAGCPTRVLHHYFPDKIDLITHCMRRYKLSCVDRYRRVLQDTTTPDQLAQKFVHELVVTLREDSPAQRLWYDMRVQSLFEPSFRDDVASIDNALRTVIWRIVSRYAELSGDRPLIDADTAFAIFDGVVSHLVLAGSGHDAGAEQILSEQARQTLTRLLAGTG